MSDNGGVIFVDYYPEFREKILKDKKDKEIIIAGLIVDIENKVFALI